MNALKLLTEQHREVDQLFDRILASGDAHERSQLLTDIGDALTIHTELEESVFYPAVRSGETEDQLEESLEEHLRAKRLLSALLDAEEEDDTFRARLRELVETVRHHVEEEENELFPQVRRILDEDRLVGLGLALLQREDELEEEESPSDRIDEEVGAPL